MLISRELSEQNFLNKRENPMVTEGAYRETHVTEIMRPVAKGSAASTSRTAIMASRPLGASRARRRSPGSSITQVSCRSLRRGVVEDLDAIVNIERTCFGASAWKEEDLAAQFGHSFARVWVWEADECKHGVSGAVGFMLSWQTEDQIQLMRLGVEPGWARRGIGTELLKHLVSREERRSTITLEVRQSNESARAFYEKFGFDTLALRSGYYNDGEDAIVMQYEIRGSPL